MCLNCPFGYGQSQAEAAQLTRTRLVQPVEAVKHSRLGTVGNPGPFILNGEFCKLCRPGFRSDNMQRNMNATAGWRILHSIVEDVNEGHPQKSAIAAD